MDHYNADFIQKCLADFADEMQYYKGERCVLFDADNTLFLFSKHGKDKQALTVCHNKGFYKNLPVFEEAPFVLENLTKFGIRVGILSKYFEGYSRDEKYESFHYHFPMVRDSDIHLVPYDVPKHEVIKDVRHTILVDDYHGNINSWYEAGGIAFKKSFSGKERPVPVVTSLIDIFYELAKLNFLTQN